MISKELLSEVLGDNVRIITVDSEILYNYFNDDIDEEIPSNILFYFSRNSMHYESINIHELAHICKEWVKSIGWSISSGTEQQHDMYRVFCSKDGACVSRDSIVNLFHKTESEAIFKACAWIKDNK